VFIEREKKKERKIEREKESKTNNTHITVLIDNPLGAISLVRALFETLSESRLSSLSENKINIRKTRITHIHPIICRTKVNNVFYTYGNNVYKYEQFESAFTRRTDEMKFPCSSAGYLWRSKRTVRKIIFYIIIKR